MNKENSNKISKKIIQRTRGSFKNFDRLNNLNVEIDSLNSVTPLVPLREEIESHQVEDPHEEDNIQYDDNEYHEEDLNVEPSPSVSSHQTFEQEENNTQEEEDNSVSEPDISHIYLQRRIEQNNLNGSAKPLSLRDLLKDYNYSLEEPQIDGNNTTSLTSIRPTARFLEIFRDIFQKVMEEQFILKSYNLYSSSTNPNSKNSAHKLEKQKSNEEILSVKLDYKLFEVFMDSVLEDIETISELVNESF